MIPAGYMAKRVTPKPEWLKAPQVKDIYSVSGCVSEDFADYTLFWRHNGFWLFDDAAIIRELAATNGFDLAGCTMFYYEAHPKQYDVEKKQWGDYDPQRPFLTRVNRPDNAKLEGYDIVAFLTQTAPECSPLSCNGVASTIATNEHCLLRSFDEAVQLLENGTFDATEPGPFRIFSVYTV